MQRQRYSTNAFFMSCLVPGWGLVYVGRVKWALRVAGFLYAGVIMAGALGLIATPKGVYALLAFIVLVKLCSAIAPAIIARKHNDSTSLPTMRFHVVYVASLIMLTLVLFYPLRSTLLGYQLYSIPSSSMRPTLEVGDYIVKNSRYSTPKVGDIVVYRFNGIEATKRVAGVPGDTLAIVNGEVINNGENLGLFFAPPGSVVDAQSQHLSPVKVEPDHVYLLGDNRDSSNDSRFMGQVPLKDITGRVTGIWLSDDHSRMGTNF